MKRTMLHCTHLHAMRPKASTDVFLRRHRSLGVTSFPIADAPQHHRRRCRRRGTSASSSSMPSSSLDTQRHTSIDKKTTNISGNSTSRNNSSSGTALVKDMSNGNKDMSSSYSSNGSTSGAVFFGCSEAWNPQNVLKQKSLFRTDLRKQ